MIFPLLCCKYFFERLNLCPSPYISSIQLLRTFQHTMYATCPAVSPTSA
jgi:hypothetical protein